LQKQGSATKCSFQSAIRIPQSGQSAIRNLQSAIKKVFQMNVLVINSGSSSIKYQLFDMTDKTVLASGLLEQIGEAESRLTHHTRTAGGNLERVVKTQRVADHREGFRLIGTVMRESGAMLDTQNPDAIGHRVVHGGEKFHQPTRINAEVVAAIRELIPLAPLHNPPNLLGIEVAMEHTPDVPQVAVFDTAFHQAMPSHAFRYAIPEDFYKDHQVRRYGFHGTSHYYVAKQAAVLMNRPFEALNLITLHLGNGASATAIGNGKSLDTSMGMTPLEGLIMGTRSGDIDPAIIFYLERKTGLSNAALESALNTQSGLKGICGVNDMREIIERAEQGDAQARLAIDMYCYRIKKYIGAYFAVLGHVDGLVFTGGIGENAAPIRMAVCQGMSSLGIELDPGKNSIRSQKAFEVQSETSTVKVLVVPTNEELEIAEQTMGVIRNDD
jgi:acetate kinase